MISLYSFSNRKIYPNAITPKGKGGSYAANNATGLKKLVEQAIALLEGKPS